MKKPKPATAGEKIARTHYQFGGPEQPEPLARRIDRAIARAVRKERERCMKILIAYRDDPNGCRNCKVCIGRALRDIEENER